MVVDVGVKDKSRRGNVERGESRRPQSTGKAGREFGSLIDMWVERSCGRGHNPVRRRASVFFAKLTQLSGNVQALRGQRACNQVQQRGRLTEVPGTKTSRHRRCYSKEASGCCTCLPHNYKSGQEARSVCTTSEREKGEKEEGDESRGLNFP